MELFFFHFHSQVKGKEDDELDGIPLSKDESEIDGLPLHDDDSIDDIDGFPIKGIFTLFFWVQNQGYFFCNNEFSHPFENV